MPTIKNVLIADDNLILANIIRNYLIENNFEVEVVCNKKELLQSLYKTIPDIILLDVFLNESDGRDICRALKSKLKTREVPIVMWSGNAYAIGDYKSYGASNFLEKPFSMQQLLSILQNEKSLKMFKPEAGSGSLKTAI